MKKNITLIFVCLLLLGSCDLLGLTKKNSEKLIGTWKGNSYSIYYLMTFKSDKTYRMNYSSSSIVLTTDNTQTGSWDADEEQIAIQADGGNMLFNYKFLSDDTLVFSQGSNVFLTLTRD